MPSGTDALPSRWRAAVIILAFPVLAFFAFTQTLAIVVESRAPDKAAAVAPWDGSAGAHLAKAAYRGEFAASPEAAIPPSDEVVTLAREAYKRQPLVPGALAVLGAAMPAYDKAAFWKAAASISRRDTLLQGSLLNFYLQADDLDRSIRVLNQILLVRVDQRRAAYAALTQALHDTRSTDTFVDILKSGPDWGNGFLIAASRDNQALANLGLIRARLPDAAIDPETDRVLVDAFAKSGELDLAYDLYSRLSSERPAAQDWYSEIPPFDWHFANEPGFGAQLIGSSDHLQVNIARGKGGVFARRIVPARSESLSIRGQYDLKPPQQSDRLEISASCVGANAPLAQANFANGKILLDTALPAGCGFVEISLSGRIWSEGEGINGSIAPLTISYNE